MERSQRTVITASIGLWTIAIVAGFASATLSAQSPSLQRSPRSQESRANPYGKLFEPNIPRSSGDPRSPVSSPPATEAGSPKVVCGMTLIPADPAIDPGIAVELPNTSMRFTIRAVEPPTCRSATAR